MRNQTKYFILIISALVLFNCSKFKEKYKIEEIDGIKYYKNTGEATGKYRPMAKFLFEIKGPENVPDSMKGFGNVADVISDENDNIYILDSKHANIKKYNRSGEFEMYFPDQKGSEIERLMEPSQLASVYDTLLVYDSYNRKYTKYLKNGDFINSFWVLTTTTVRPMILKSDSKTNISAFTFSRENINEEEYSINRLCVLNPRFKIQNVIREIKMLMDTNFFFPDMLTSYAIKDGLFYIAENLSDAYRIYVVDNRGRMQYCIEKEFTKIAYNDIEIKQLNDIVVTSRYSPLDPNKVYYKKAINTIEIDKNDKLWVQPSLNRTEANQDSFYIDIFEKGIFLNRTVLDFISGNETYKLKGNRIYVIAEDRKSVRVYDYQ